MFLISSICLLLISICLCVFIKHWQKCQFWQKQNIELLSTWSVFCRTRKVQLYQVLLEIYEKMCSEQKPFVVMESFVISTVIVQDQSAIKQVLTSQFENFPDRGFYVNPRDALLVNLARLHYDIWKPLRAKLTPAFSPAKLKYVFPTMASVGDQLVEVLANEVRAGDSVVEMLDICKRFAMDVIGTIAFGIDCNSLKDPRAELKIECEKAFEQHFRPFVDQFGEKYSGFLNWINFKYHSPESIEFFTKLVKETLEHRQKHNIKRNDYLDLFLEFRDNVMTQDRNGDGEPKLSLEIIVGQVFIFFIGGFESTSSALSEALFELAKHPEIQEKARQEIKEIQLENDNKISYESLKQQKYTKQVVQETLRKYPILHSLMRYSRRPCSLLSTTGQSLAMPKDTTVIIPSHGIHYNPEFYPSPHEFRPERFDEAEIAKRPPYTFLSFGDGPRSCLASGFGLLELQFALATLLSQFRFSLCEKSPQKIEFDRNKKLTMSVGNKVNLKVEIL